MEQLFIEASKSQGIPFIMACIALAFIQQMNRGLITRLNEERHEHMKALGQQINDLKEAILECERDRKELWSKITK